MENKSVEHKIENKNREKTKNFTFWNRKGEIFKQKISASTFDTTASICDQPNSGWALQTLCCL